MPIVNIPESELVFEPHPTGKGSHSFIDITHHLFSRLYVLGFAGSVNKRALWYCRCECGNICLKKGKYLRNGETKSCGCLVPDTTSKLNATHGQSKSRLYKTWTNVKKRCLNQNTPDFQLYGAKGVTICDEWSNSFEKFASDMGEPPSKVHSIDRYHPNWSPGDPPLPYSPETCRWATPTEQQRNKDISRTIVYNGRSLSIAEWADITGISYSALFRRLGRGWCNHCTLTIPCPSKHKNSCKH